MKKFMSLLLCALMVMSLTLTAFAIPPEAPGTEPMSPTNPGAEPQVTCTNHIYVNYQDRNKSITNFGDGTCGYEVYLVGTCKFCKDEDWQETGRKSGVASHTYTLSSATCNGYDQTRHYNCTRGCGASKTETKRCLMAGHSGGCQWLPI